MEEYTLYAREDSNTAQNQYLNVQGNSDTVELMFVPEGGTGDLLLDYNDGLSDPDTMVWIGDDKYSFTVEYIGAFVDKNALENVNGYNLNGQEIAIITINGQRYFFFTDPTYKQFETMQAFPNGGFQVDIIQPPPATPICFVKGTAIRCEYGDVAIENLRVGDNVWTSDGILSEIKWIGRRILSGIDLTNNPHLKPIRIKKNALGPNTPSKDLLVSPQHRMLLDGWRVDLLFSQNEVLAAAKHLVNDHSITVENSSDTVEYFHILFETHEIIYANDALSESFHPGQWAIDSLDNAVREEVFELFPHLRDDIALYGPTACRSLKAFEANALNSFN